MIKTTAHEVFMKAITMMENRLEELSKLIEEEVELYGEMVYMASSEYPRISLEARKLTKSLHKLYQEDLLSNVIGVVTEVKYEENKLFTVVIKVDDTIHIYKGLNVLNVAVSQEVEIGDKLGEVNKELYYEVKRFQ